MMKKTILLYFIMFGIFSYSLKLSEIKGTSRLSDYNQIKDIEVKRYVDYDNYERKGDYVYAYEEKEPFTGIAVMYESGNIVGLFFYEKGKKEGIHHEYYQNGILELTMEFKNDKKNGIQKDYDEKGRVTSEFTFVNGVKHGIQKDYDEQGRLTSEFPFVNGVKNGPQKDYYPNGKLDIQTEFKDGKKNGSQYRYTEKGELGMKVEFKDDKIQTIEVYSPGIKKSNRIGINYTKFVSTGEDKGIVTGYKDKLKIIESEVKIVNHRQAEIAQQGQVTYFYPNGNKKITLIKVDNKIEGLIRTYSENGTLIIETNGKDNKQNGEVKIYYPTGEKQLWCEKVVGEMIRGNCEIYRKDGSILHKGYFDNVSLDTLRREKMGDIKDTKGMMDVINRYM